MTLMGLFCGGNSGLEPGPSVSELVHEDPCVGEFVAALPGDARSSDGLSKGMLTTWRAARERRDQSGRRKGADSARGGCRLEAV